MADNCIFIEPGHRLKGTVTINPSKSYCHRYLVIGALFILSGRSDKISLGISSLCDDVRATMDCLEEIGVHCEINGTIVTLSKKDIPEDFSPELNCRESGTTLRFLIPVTALFFDSFTINGNGSLISRPIKAFLDSLSVNGLEFETGTDFSLPIKVKGRLKSGDYIIPGNISSQYISALLMSLPFTTGNSSINLITRAQSVPYIKMTLKALEEFGIIWSGSDFKGYLLNVNKCDYKVPDSLIVPEGDWSSAAFWFGSNFLGSEINITGLNEDSLQGDSRICDMLKMLAKTRPIDVSNTPDIFPVLAVCASLKPYKTIFTGISRLKYKESNRISSVVHLIKSIGGNIKNEGDKLAVYGKNILKGGTVNSFGDHRIAMAAFIAASCTENGIKLVDYDVADKSYPSFYDDFKKLGGRFNVCDLG